MDELERLRIHPPLLQLLSHYAALAEPDRQVWHDRLTDLGGVEPPQLTHLHGDLLALGWIEWTSGQIAPKSRRIACYRVTGDGLRAHRQVAGSATAAESTSSDDNSISKRPRQKRKKPTPELAVATP